MFARHAHWNKITHIICVCRIDWTNTYFSHVIWHDKCVYQAHVIPWEKHQVMGLTPLMVANSFQSRHDIPNLRSKSCRSRIQYVHAHGERKHDKEGNQANPN